MRHEDPQAYPLWSAWNRQRHGLLCAMNAEASAAIISIEGIAATLEPADHGKFTHEKDGSCLFLWRGKPVCKFTFEPGRKAGQGLQLVVDRLYLKEDPTHA